MDQCRFTKFNTFLYQSYNNPPGASQADFLEEEMGFATLLPKKEV